MSYKLLKEEAEAALDAAAGADEDQSADCGEDDDEDEDAPTPGSPPPEIVKKKKKEASELDENSTAQSTNIAPVISWFQILTFGWVTPYLRLGQDHPITTQELPELPKGDDSKSLGERAWVAWQRQLALEPKTAGQGATLARSLWSLFGRGVLIASMPVVINILLRMLQPYLLMQLIHHCGKGQTDMLSGLTWAGLIFGVDLLRNFCYANISFREKEYCGRIKTALSALVYRKSLKLHSVADGNASNMLGVDTSKISHVVFTLSQIVTFPLHLSLALAMLYQLMGWAAFTPMTFILCIGPANAYILLRFDKMWTGIMQHKDERIKQLNEILSSGILTVKAFVWEQRMTDRVMENRQREVAGLQDFVRLLAILIFILLTATGTMAMVAFVTFVASGSLLTAEVVFPGLMVLGTLTTPLIEVPILAARLSEASISLKRLEMFMRRDEVSARRDSRDAPAAADGNQDDGTVMGMVDASFEHLEPDMVIDAASLANIAAAASPPESKGPYAPLEQVSIDHDDDNKEDKNGMDTEAFKLHNLSFSVGRGKLVAVVGRVGQGKSSLCEALLGEMRQLGGRSYLRGSVAFAAQSAWIRNASVRDNIVFGAQFEQGRYDAVLQACALLPDLEILPQGDATVIGERGINVSGGQKQRIALARAAYSRSDCVLLDDPLSAVDSHVGQHLFDQCICGLMRGRTRLLVTHALQYLPKVDRVLVMQDGTIQQRGTYDELVHSAFDFAALISAEAEAKAKAAAFDDAPAYKSEFEANAGPVPPQTPAATATATATATADDVMTADFELQLPGVAPILGRLMSDCKSDTSTSARSGSGGSGASRSQICMSDFDCKSVSSEEKQQAIQKIMAMPEREDPGSLVEDEHVETGTVSMAVLRWYISQFSRAVLFVVIVSSLTLTGLEYWISIWLGKWVDFNAKTTDAEGAIPYFAGFYCLFCVARAASAYVRQMTWAKHSLEVAKQIHNQVLAAVLRSPMSFFFKTPTGRIINRFSSDMGRVDHEVSNQMSDAFRLVLEAAWTLALICYVVPWCVIPLAVAAKLYINVAKLYRATGRQIERIHSASASPIYALYSETLGGLKTIRAYRRHRVIETESNVHITAANKCYRMSSAASRWLGTRLSFMGNMITLAAALCAIALSDELTPGTIGLLIMVSGRISDTFISLSRQLTALEAKFSSVERLQEYAILEPEAALETPQTATPLVDEWPQAGKIEINDLTMRYRIDLDPVLHDISVVIEPRQKVGLVGRTGSGKSSLINALFRFVEPDRPVSRLSVDGIDIFQLGLGDLRRSISLIPQEAFLFSGTIRSNLDPFGQYSDDQLWQALERVHLAEFVRQQPLQLEGPVESRGSNLSVGQRSLVSFARALLQNTKLLVMDEATASIDQESDEQIQRTIHSEFKDRTCIVIAHRLHSVIDLDRVLVLDQGRVVEYDSPHALLQKPNGHFRSFVEQTGPAQSAQLKARAMEAWARVNAVQEEPLELSQ